MEPTNEKDALMRAYLLGDLPEGDRQQIEELYFAVDEEFDRLAAVEADLVDGYVEGTLTAEERTLFERNYLTSDEGRRHVDFARQLLMAARRERTSFREHLQAMVLVLRESLVVSRWGTAIATVCVALIVILNLSVYRHVNDESANDTLGPSDLSDTGGPEDGPITGAGAQPVEKIEIAVPAGAQYATLPVSSLACGRALSAELQDNESGRILWRDVVRCATTTTDRATLQIPTRLLSEDTDYTVTLHSQGQVIDRYVLQVRFD